MCALRITLIVTGLFVCSEPAPGGVGASGDKAWWEKTEGRISIGKEEFAVGEPIFVNVVFTNRHREPVRIPNTLYRSFEFFLEDSSEASARKLRMSDPSGLYRTVSIPSGDSLGDVAFINEQIDIRAPGVYTVGYRGSVRIRKGSQENGSVAEKSIVISGAVDVKVRSGSQDELDSALRGYLKHLRSSDRRLQRQAALALSVSQPVLAVGLLEEALVGEPTPDPWAISHAAWALAKIGTDKAVEVLADVAIHSPSHRVRMSAATQLGRFRIARAVPTLTELLSDPDARIRIAALRALGSIGDRSCLPFVEARLSDRNTKVRTVAGETLEILIVTRSPDPNSGEN